jgi:hypothetical protein
VRHLLGVLVGEGRVAALLETRAFQRGVLGQEARQAGELDDGEQPTGRQQVMDLAQSTVGVRQVVHRRRGPGELRLPEVGPLGVEIDEHGAHPLGHPERLGLVPQPVQVALRRVDGGHLGAGETGEQRKGAGTRPTAQIQDLARLRRDGQPRDDRRGVLGQHFGVEFENLRLPFGVRLGMWVVGAAR